MVTGVTLLATELETAQAALITETESFSIFRVSPVDDSELRNFNQFNPALGTLTAVNFELTSSNTTTATINVFAGPEFNAFGGTRNDSSFAVQVNSPSLGTIFGPQSGLAITSCFAEPGGDCTDSQFDTQTFDGVFAVPGGSVGGFVGSGDFDATLAFSSFLIPACEGEGAECTSSGSIDWTGALTVQYTFNPAINGNGVPEPGTLVLLGAAGLAGLGLARRRKEPSAQ